MLGALDILSSEVFGLVPLIFLEYSIVILCEYKISFITIRFQEN